MDIKETKGRLDGITEALFNAGQAAITELGSHRMQGALYVSNSPEPGDVRSMLVIQLVPGEKAYPIDGYSYLCSSAIVDVPIDGKVGIALFQEPSILEKD